MTSLTPESPWRTSGDTTLAAFAAELAGSPVAAEADVLCDLADPYGRLYLAHSKIENQHDTVGILIDPGMHNNLALRPRGYPEELGTRNGFAVFPRYQDCLTAWRRRLSDVRLCYLDAVTMLEYSTCYNPASDTHPVTGVVNDPVRYCNRLLTTINRLPEEGAPPMAEPQNIVVVAGHRSTGDPGNPSEKERTDDLARAYRDALRAAGHEVWWLQENDGDADPDDTVGGLDTVGRRTLALCESVGATLMLDLHFEGHGNTSVRGCFAIVPDVTGLTTAVPGGAPPHDTWANNPLDQKVGRALTEAIRSQTGIPLRTGIREPGLMDEGETGVGAQGFRLAMFAYTVPRQPEMVRLVVEHGALTNPQDRAIIDAPGFYQKVGQAAVMAVNTVFGAPEVPDEPDPPTDELAYPPGWDALVAAEVWGTAYSPDWDFNPAGVVSRIYIDERVCSRLIYRLRQPGGRDLFVFTSGHTIGRLADTESYRVLAKPK